jgi:hypothetical protein
MSRPLKKNNRLDVIATMLLDDFDVESTILQIEFLDKPNCETIFNKYFALIDYDKETFYLSFCLNYSTFYDVAFMAHILTLYLGDKLQIYTEHFIDIKDGTMYFGNNAHEKNIEVINTRKGLRYCMLCDKSLPKEMFAPDDLYCMICTKLILPNVSFH